MEYLYNYSSNVHSNPKDPSVGPQWREPRGTLVLMDRTFDLATPLIHDYTYESTVYDYLEVSEDGSLEKVLPPQQPKVKKGA